MFAYILQATYLTSQTNVNVIVIKKNNLLLPPEILWV